MKPTWFRRFLRQFRRGVPRRYDVFISYSHRVDRGLAPAVQTGIQQLAKPWYRRHALRVFRDETDLGSSPGLWPAIRTALVRSRHFVLLASPESSKSAWVQREVKLWLRLNGIRRLHIAITSGRDPNWSLEDITDTETNPLPQFLRKSFASEPGWVDLRNVRSNSEFRREAEPLRDALARLAGPIRGMTPAELIGRDYREYRRTMRTAWGVAFVLVALLVASVVMTIYARRQQHLAESRQLAAQAIAELWSNPRSSVKDALEAIARSETDEAKQALDQSLSQSNVRAVLSDPDKAPLSAAAFSRNEGFIITSTYWGKVWSWAYATSKPLHYFPSGGYFRVSADSLSSDGRYLLTTLDDKDGYWVAIYDFKDGTALGRFRASRVGPVISATFSPSGKYIATAGEDYGAAVWDATAILNALQPSTEPKGIAVAPIAHYEKLHTDIVNSIRFGEQEEYVVTSSQDGRAKIWEWKSHRVIELRRYTRALFSAEFHPRDIHTVLTAGQDGYITLWTDAFAKHISIDRQWHKLDALQASFDASGMWVVTASSDGKAVVWNPGDESKNYTLIGHRGAVTGAAFSPEGRSIVTASVDGTARIWMTRPVPDLRGNQAKIHYLRSLLSVR